MNHCRTFRMTVKSSRYFISAVLLPFCLMFLGCPLAPDRGHTWISLGYVSAGSAGEPWEGYYGNSITIDLSDNKPVVAVNDQGQVSVKKWVNGTTWTDLGNPISGSGNMPCLAIDPSDSKPIVVFYEGSGGRARVSKWSSGTSWTNLGYVSPSGAHCPRIAVDPSDNKPIVVYAEFVGGSFNYIQALKWSSGTTWTDLGYPSPGESMNPALAVDPTDNKPIVAFSTENYDHVHVLKWSSDTTWIDLGAPRPSEGGEAALVIDPTDHKPVISMRIQGVYVNKWSSGTNWTDLGCANFAESWSPDIAITVDGIPMVVSADYTFGGRAHVKKWDGGKSWSSMGFPSDGEAAHTSIVIDPSDNLPIVLFSDGQNGWRAKVMKHAP